MSGTASATGSCAGASRPSAISASCRRAPASATRSISNICRRPCGSNEEGGRAVAYPDTLVGTDSHTTMVNGLAVLGWGVGGIEAEAAMLGQPISMLIPEVIGFKLTGKLREGVTATDLVLTVTEMLRKKGVVGKFVEFYGPGLDHMALEDRATIGNMAPEYGATCGFFPIDAETLALSRGHRPRSRAGRAGRGLCAGRRACSAARDTPDPVFTDTLVARPRHRRAVARRSEAPAGPRRSSPTPKKRFDRRPRQRVQEAADESDASGVDVKDGARLRHRPRRRGDRGDHVLHQHVQPVRDDRRRPARPQGAREGPDSRSPG